MQVSLEVKLWKPRHLTLKCFKEQIEQERILLENNRNFQSCCYE